MVHHLWLVCLPLHTGVAVAQDSVEEPPSSSEQAETDSPFDLQRPPAEADLLARDVELGVRLAFNDYRPGPFSLFTSLAGWNELALTLDVGAFAWRDFTFSFGGDIHYGGSWILSALTQRIANYDNYDFRWSMWESGATFRASMHYTALSSVDPYLFVGAGGAAFSLRVSERAWPQVPPETVLRGTLRFELGGGVAIPVKSDWRVAIDLRYLITSQINPVEALVLTNGDEEATFTFFPQHKPPKGFSWGLRFSRRF